MTTGPTSEANAASCEAAGIAPSDCSRQDRLRQAIDEFYAAVDAGRPPDRSALLAKYADVAEELDDCLSNLDFIKNVAPQLAAATAPESADEGSAVSQRVDLGDFRIIREIGRGGMGVVYEAEQLSLGRRMALKVLPFATMLDKQQLKRFKNEARAAASLDHPNIVAVHSVGEERGVHYYAMQLIEGQSLAQILADLRAAHGIRRHPLSVQDGQTVTRATTRVDTPPADAPDSSASEKFAESIGAPNADTQRGLQAAVSTVPPFASGEYFHAVGRLAEQAARALDHAHQNGILHRDIKPGNLLVDGAGNLQVTDFGLARIEADAGMTMTGDLLGTLAYMSPEQALAKRVLVDHRTDIYSLGATLYELLSLRPLYVGRDRQELLRQIAFEEPRGLRKLNPAIPREIETIVGKATTKNPADRYTTAGELADDLRRYLENVPILARRPTPVDRLTKWSRRHVGIVWMALAASVVVVALLAVSTALVAQSRRQVIAQREEAEREKDDAQQQRDVAIQQRNAARQNRYYAEIVSSQTDLQNQSIGSLHTKLIGYLPIPDEPDNRGWEWYYLMSLCHSEVRTLRPYKTWDRDGSCFSFASWSPDGTLIATPGSIWNAKTGACIRSFVPSLIRRYRVAWSPTGQQLAWGMASDENAFYVWDRETDAVSRWSGHQASVWCVAWSPDGAQLASGSLDSTVRIWDVASRTTVRTIPTEHCANNVAWSPDGALLAASLNNKRGARVWNPSTGELVVQLPGDGSVSWHPDGKVLATSSDEGWYLFDRADWSVTNDNKTIRGGAAIAWSPDGTQIAVTDGESIAIWDAEGKEQLAVIAGHLRKVKSVAWSPDGRSLVTSDRGGEVKLWDLSSSAQPPDIATGSALKSIAWLPDSDTLVAIGQEDQSQAFYNVADGSLKRRELPVVNVPFRLSPDRRFALIQSTEKPVLTVLDAQSGKTHSVLPVGKQTRLPAARFSPDSATVAIQGIVKTESFVEFWNVDAEQRISSWTRQQPQGDSDRKLIAWDSNGSRVAVVSRGDVGDDGSQYWTPHVHVIDVASGTRTHKHQLTVEGDISSLAWSVGGRCLALGTSTGWIETIDVASKRRQFASKISDKRICSVAWSGDGKLLACAAVDGVVRLVSTEGRVNLLSFSLSEEGAASLAWSPDGKRLAAATSRGTIHQWDATRGYEFAAGATRRGELAWGAYHDRAVSTSGREQELALHEMLRHAPDALGFWEGRGSVLAQLGDYTTAAQEFAKAITPDVRYSFSAAVDRARCLFAVGKLDLYDQACASLVDEFSESPVPSNRVYVAWLCALAPHRLANFKQVLEMVESSLDQEDNKNGSSFSLALGASLYRDRQFDRAVSVLSQLTAKLDRGGDPMDRYELTCSGYFLAMARQELGHEFQARRLLRKANRNSDCLHSIGVSWRQQVVLKALQREAEELMHD